MQNIIIPLILSTLAGLSTLIGAIPIFFNIKEKNLNKYISFCLSFSIAIMISISIIDLGLRLSVAIMLHNIPEGISIAVPIYYATGSRKKAIKSTLISGLSEPLGAILAYVFLKRFVSELMISIVLIVVAGLMITLSIQEMLPRALKYKENKWIYLGLVIGTILVIINVIIS